MMNNRNDNDKYPLVTVIVPVRNGEQTIDKLLSSLLSQDYPSDKTEIIIVDNGSQDQTLEMVKKHPVTLEKENKTFSSYAARNKGLSVANGEIIAFTDADCVPKKDWIREGVIALIEQNADMVGGKISFLLSDRPSAAELIDSLTFMQNEQNIKNKQTAVTANLFVRKELFNKLGLFEEVKSGGDFQWTHKATQNDFSLIYAPQVIVYHPARNLRQLLNKGRRIKTGTRSFVRILYAIIRLPVPIPSIRVLKLIIASRGRYLFTVWGVSYLLQLNELASLLLSLIFKTGKVKMPR